MLVIFDCDGTLVDSEPIANRVLAEVVTEAGLPMTPAQSTAQFLGCSMAMVIEAVEAALGRPLPGDFRTRYRARLHAEMETSLEPIPGVRDVLDALEGPRCVASNGDLETVEVSTQAALTGHLVLTTLHASTAPGALKRLLDVGLPAFLVNDTIVGVIAQRLVPLLCPECKEPAQPAEHSVPSEAVEFLSAHRDATFYVAKGCEKCRSTGYHGRTAVHEILVMDDSIRRVVAGPCDVATLRKAAIEAGMKTMLIDGMEKAARGITSIEEVIRTVPHGMDV